MRVQSPIAKSRTGGAMSPPEKHDWEYDSIHQFPSVAHLRQLIQNGDQLAKQADTSDQNALAQEKQQLDALTSSSSRPPRCWPPLGSKASCWIFTREAFPTGKPRSRRSLTKAARGSW